MKRKPQKRTIAIQANYARQWVYENNESSFATMTNELCSHINTFGLLPEGYEIVVRPEVIIQRIVAPNI